MCVFVCVYVYVCLRTNVRDCLFSPCPLLLSDLPLSMSVCMVSNRGGEVSMDVSADLMELGKTQVAVVCAGVKSILDIDKTLQVLETQVGTGSTIGEIYR